VFLPGAREINQVQRLLESKPGDFALHVLHGDLPFERQKEALRDDAGQGKRVILSTPIAETSLTIHGVKAVIDSGLARVLRFDPDTGLDRLETERISKDSAEQRAGRAGRLSEGKCVRMWSQEEQAALPVERVPEVLRADCARAVLELHGWGVRDPAEWGWLTPPSKESLDNSGSLLLDLGAITADGKLTPHGRQLLGLGLHPRLGELLIAGATAGAERQAARVISLLEERGAARRDDAGTDLTQHLSTFDDASRSGTDQRVREVAARYEERVTALELERTVKVHDDDVPGYLLAKAFPDRIAQRRPGEGTRYLTAGGKGLSFAREDRSTKFDYLVVPAFRDNKGDCTPFASVPFNPSLFDSVLRDLVVVRRRIGFDPASGKMLAVEESCCGALVLKRKPLQDVDTVSLWKEVLDDAAFWEGFPWSESMKELWVRAEILRTSHPELDFPELGEKTLAKEWERWLGDAITGARSKADLERLAEPERLRALVSWDHWRKLDELVPKTFVFPNGRTKQIEYASDGVANLEGTVQDFFGLRTTPTIAGGRKKLRLFLLSPAKRPVQVTDDLEGFWRGSYQEVRKEMKGRYPKHPWPEDPWNALPVVRGKRT
jgi:ATP-dependent helicase HrpB